MPQKFVIGPLWRLPKPKQNIGSHGFKDDGRIDAAVAAMAGNTGRGLIAIDNSNADPGFVNG